MATQLAKNSPYSASFTGAGMMWSETNVLIPLLLEKTPEEVLQIARKDTSFLKIKAQKSRGTVTREIIKRYNALPRSFWEKYLTWGEQQQRLALLYTILKTYRLLFEFQINLVIPKYNSPDRVLTKNDIQMSLSELASRDAFVDSWSDETRDRLSSQYLAMLRQGGLINETTKELQEPLLPDEDFLYYIRIGEVWFLQACLLPGYKIEQLKQLAV